MTRKRDRLIRTATGALAAALLLNPIASPVAMFVQAQDAPDAQTAEAEKETSGLYDGSVSTEQAASDFQAFMDSLEPEQAQALEESQAEWAAQTFSLRTSQSGQYVYLDEKNGYPPNASQSWYGWYGSKPKVNKNASGGTISVLRDGTRVYYANGFGFEANGHVNFDLSQLADEYPILEGYIGIDASKSGANGNVSIWVDASRDGKTWDKKIVQFNLQGKTEAYHFRLDLAEEGYKYVCISAGNNKSGDYYNNHVSLADFRVLAADYNVAEEETYSKVSTLEQLDNEISAHSVEENFSNQEYLLKVLQREFVNRIGYHNIQVIYRDNPVEAKATLDWLLEDLDTLQLFLEAGDYYLGSGYSALNALVDLYTAYGDDVNHSNPIYKKMMLATAAAHSRVIYSFAHYSNSGNLNYSDPVERYELFKNLYDTGRFVRQSEFEQYPMELIRAVVDTRMDNDEINWLRDYIDRRYPDVNNGWRYGGYGYTWYNSGHNYNNSAYYSQDNYQKWNEKYLLSNYPEIEYGISNRYRIYMVIESGAICWGISGLASAVNEVQGIASIGSYQPGHEPSLLYHHNNGKGTWSIETSVGGWSGAYSKWTDGFEYRLPLEWGSQSYVSKGAGSMNTSYILLAQDALNDYDNYVNSMLYNLIAKSYPQGSDNREAALEASLNHYDKNLDALYGYYLSYSADSSTTDTQWRDLAQRITDKLTYFPKPMVDLLNLIKGKVSSENTKAEIDIMRYDALTKASVATPAQSLQNGACQEIAKALLGKSTEFATFSFDGDNANTIVIDPLYDEYNMQFEVSLDGGVTLEEFENGQTYTENHKIVLTEDQVKKINHEDDIVIGLRGVTTTHVIDIQKGSAVGNGIYVNDNENMLIAYGNQTKNLEYSVDGGDTWHTYVPGLTSTTRVEGEVNALFRYKAYGIYTAGEETPIAFHADTDPDTSKYLQLQHVEMVGFSSQNSTTADHAAINLLDGNANTAWHSTYGVKDTEKYYTVKFDQVRFISKLTYLPGGENGRWAAGTVYSSLDGETWVPIHTFSGWGNDANWKTAAFDMSYPSLYIKVVLSNTHGNRGEGPDKYVSGKMLNFYEDTTKVYDPADIPAITQTGKLMDMNQGDVAMAPISIHQGTAIPMPMSTAQDNFDVVWTSSNEKVATVKNGQVTAVAPGDAVVSVTVTSKIGLKCKASVYVTVQDPNSEDRNFPSAFESQVSAQPFDVTTTYEKQTQDIQSGATYVIYSGAKILYHENGQPYTDQVGPSAMEGNTITPNTGYHINRQTWVITRLEDGTYTIRSCVASGAYLALNDSATSAGSRIPVSAEPKPVHIEATGDGGYVIYHEVNGQKLYLSQTGNNQYNVSTTPKTLYLFEKVEQAGYYEYSAEMEGLSSLVEQVRDLEQGDVADGIWNELMDALSKAEALIADGPYVYDNEQAAQEKTDELNACAAALYDAWCALYRENSTDEYLQYAAQVKEMLATDKLLTSNAKAQMTAAVAALEEAASAAKPSQETLDTKLLALENLVNGLYTISVNGEAQFKGLYGEIHTIEAPAAGEGNKFAGWKVEEKVVSTKESYNFAITGTANYVATYVEVVEEVTQKPSADIISTIGTKRTDGKVDAKFVAQLTVPQGYKMLEVGLFWASSEGAELCTANGPTSAAKKSSVSKVNVNYQYSVTINGLPKGRFVRGVSYAKLQAPDGAVVWVYSSEYRISNP